MIGKRSVEHKKFKPCSFCADKVDDIDFKDTIKLKRYLTERGKIIPRRITGNCAYHQRKLATAVKKARENALIPYIMEG
ncbi:MAG: 30S ribosomal protein S18 [Candidatus Gastranaerophilales bacterium]|nr:30S ribosomal protein S18 [Candidatus Gastranaerophilales bacterium]